MRNRAPRLRKSGWIGLFLILPCAALAQQRAPTPAAEGAQSAQNARATAPAGSGLRASAPGASSAAQRADDPEPAVDTSREAVAVRQDRDHRTRRPAGGAAPRASAASRPPGKAVDHLELGTTDITGNRELPKVMYIVPWKRSDVGDLTGKPLDSLIDQTLQPVDRSVFRRENRYYRAVSGSAAQDAHPGAGGGAAPAARDER